MGEKERKKERKKEKKKERKKERKNERRKERKKERKKERTKERKKESKKESLFILFSHYKVAVLRQHANVGFSMIDNIITLPCKIHKYIMLGC